MNATDAFPPAVAFYIVTSWRGKSCALHSQPYPSRAAATAAMRANVNGVLDTLPQLARVTVHGYPAGHTPPRFQP